MIDVTVSFFAPLFEFRAFLVGKKGKKEKGKRKREREKGGGKKGGGG